MQFDSNTPRTDRTIAGRKVQVIQPFAEGQPLTEATAAMLNQTLAENFSNNLRKKVEAAGDAADDAAIQAIVDEYMGEYQPGVRASSGGSARVVDPVEREARKLAKEKVRQLLKDRGLKAADVDFEDLVNKLYAKHEEAFITQGKAIVKALEKARSGNDEFTLDIDVPEAAAA